MRSSLPLPLVLLGFGDTARAVLEVVRASGAARPVFATTRQASRTSEIAGLGVTPILLDPELGPATREAIEAVARDADVIVSLPPDGRTDRVLATWCGEATSLVYVSSTAVYGARSGVIDSATEPDPDTARGRVRREAELLWQAVGAAVVRAPGIYGGDGGMLAKIRRGAWQTPGDGSGVVSRIHLRDLATIALAALAPAHRGASFVVGDHEPAPIGDVVDWICKRLDLPAPPSIPLEQAPESLRRGRAVDARDALTRLGVTLRFPTYREGLAALIDAEASGLER